MNEPKKNTHGGKRRDGVTQKAVTFRISNDLLPELHSQPNMNKFVNEAIREKLTNLKEN